MIKLTDLLKSILPENRIPNRYIEESKQVIKEISLNPSNAFDVTYEEDGGYFYSSDTKYIFGISILPDEFILPGDKTHTLFVGGMIDIGFSPEGNTILNEPVGGRENLVKIYSTMYKIILDIASKHKPAYLSISCTKSSGYFPIYSNLTKSNNTPGYHRKMVVSWNHPELGDMQSIVLTKNTNI